MYIKCISIKSINETRTMHPKSKQVEVYMGSNTENVIDKLVNTLLQNFQRMQETSNKRGSEFLPDSVELLEYELHKVDISRAELYIITPDWIANIIKEKELKKLLKLKRIDTDFSSHQRYWENVEQENNPIAINVLFVSHNSEEIRLPYKPSIRNVKIK